MERHRDIIDALNVFPVPDGDTGTNMLLTMRAGLTACDDSPASDLGEVGQTLSQGLFLGARGNSGVILSQFFRGFCAALAGRRDCIAADLAQAFSRATEEAYGAVGQPVEGTMLSVVRAASQGAQQARTEVNVDIGTIWQNVFSCSRKALALTPTQLPVLAEAGVVDAGGMGMVAIFGGISAYFSGQDPDLAGLGVDLKNMGLPNLNQAFVDASHQASWGYCTQLLIEGEGLALEKIRQYFGQISESVVVVGDEQCVRVHVHAEDPGPALSYAVSLGQLSQIQIENMSQQNRHWAASSEASETTTASDIAVVAIAQGDGFARLFRDSGCSAVINGGQTMNPSVGQIIQAAQATRSKDVIVLTNNHNIVAAANQAQNETDERFRLHVVPTQTIPQGVAAILAFNPEMSLEQNLRSMCSAWVDLVTIEVTQAVRDATIGGKPVTRGQHIALVNGEMAVADQTAESATLKALNHVGLSSDLVVTLYLGEGSTEAAAQRISAELENRVPGIQVEVVYGGQPHYPYLASVE